MKVSVSLAEEDVRFLDEYAREKGIGSRSGAVHEAIAVLRAGQLAGAYEDAWASWEDSGEAEVWEPSVGDGLSATG